eukprot:TRINITY_DN10619_c0_g1_i1.p1 TRINITY_DN10619_c0_g1~~TRINITY_DN10619_c0_g1_i1.p1  ORF type:complete len:150 (+),score=50.87 TRINITY_DN10619_c0_g1_i1:50-499(+)
MAWLGALRQQARRCSCRTFSGASEGAPHEVKGSVFVAHCLPTADVAATRAAAKELKHRGGFGHACWGFRGRGFDERGSDDGEPKGTAGNPILREMEKARVRDAAVIVTRDYGGVKLGTGGLVHAYSAAARLALETAQYTALDADPRFKD